jgi:hypothetical protein
MGTPHKLTPEVQRALVRRYTVQRWSLVAIAAYYGVTPQAVHYQLRKAGVVMRRPGSGKGGRPRGVRTRRRCGAVVVAATERACLRCDTPFPSEGPHHRLCGPCRAANATADIAPGWERYVSA